MGYNQVAAIDCDRMLASLDSAIEALAELEKFRFTSPQYRFANWHYGLRRLA